MTKPYWFCVYCKTWIDKPPPSFCCERFRDDWMKLEANCWRTEAIDFLIKIVSRLLILQSI